MNTIKNKSAVSILLNHLRLTIVNRVCRQFQILADEKKIDKYLDEDGKLDIKEFKKMVLTSAHVAIDTLWGKKCKAFDCYIVKMNNERLKKVFYYDEVVAAIKD